MALVEFEVDDGLAWLTFNRPEALNALSPNLFVELRSRVDEISKRTNDIGCVLLGGKGRSFSAGNDLKAIQSGEVAPGRHYQAETLEAIEALPQPVIAVVQGHCYTGALEVALACDLLICAEGAKFADTHGKWGMTPTWGMSQRLPRRIGPLRAREMMFSGRVVSGPEAVDLGLANKAVPDDELQAEAARMARGLLDNSWHTLRADKMLVNGGLQRGLADGLVFERENSPDMTRVLTHLMFQGEAEQALKLYASVFREFRVDETEQYGEGEQGVPGTLKLAQVSFGGHQLLIFDSPPVHDFSFTASMSLFVDFDTRDDLDAAFTQLSRDGQVMMPPDGYGFSKRFAWIADRFGVSWQLNLP